MDKDRIKGKAEDVAGRIKRQTGEWTGDEKTQAEGAADQLKGKTRNAVGKIKDAARDAADEVRKDDAARRNEDIERDKDAA
jgi:uncharacterized protein YjbJ (UPF0337 family)